MKAWYANPYTGLFRRLAAIPPRPHDPDVALWAGATVSWSGPERLVGGAGWTSAEAEGACAGEAVERLHTAPLPRDAAIEASFAAWPLDEPPVPPERWVLFHREQYLAPGFPYAPIGPDSTCRWTCVREALSGEAWWAPEEMVFLEPRVGRSHAIGPAVSTGLACGRPGDPVLLRGLQEVIERDALMGAWWGSYELEAWDDAQVWDLLGADLAERLVRPNLTYRFFRIASPFSSGVALVSLEGEDREGYCFSVGSACREELRAAWLKALLEAVQGRHYVRHLKQTAQPADPPADFAGHAAYYSLHPEGLSDTVLARARPRRRALAAQPPEDLAALCARLGPEHPVLWRDVTPVSVMRAPPGWTVLRVLVPGLQPMHGHHRLAHLGGSLWAPRGLAEWAVQPPHPFP